MIPNSFSIGGYSDAAFYGLLVACVLLAAVVGTMVGRLRLLIERLGRGGAAITRPSCRACGSTVRGEGEAIPDHCAECGVATANDHAIRLVAFPSDRGLRRWASLAVAMFLTLIGLAVALSPLAMTTKPLRMPELLSTRAARTATTEDDLQMQRMMYTIEASSDQWSTEELQAIFDRFLARVRESDRKSRDLRLLAIGEELVRRKAMTLDQLQTIVRSIDVHPTLHMTPRAKPSSEVVLQCAVPGGATNGIIIVHDVTVSSKVPTGNSSPLPARITRAVTKAYWSFEAPAEPGDYEVEIRWEAGWDVNQTWVLGEGERRELRTLTVAHGPERLERVVDPARAPFDEILEWPILSIQTGPRGAGARHGVVLYLPNTSLRLMGRWTLRCGDVDYPLQAIVALNEYRQASGSVLVTPPADGWPEVLTLRYHPTAEPVDAIPSEWNSAPTGMTNEASRLGRHIEGMWARTTDFTLRRMPVGQTFGETYSLERVTVVDGEGDQQGPGFPFPRSLAHRCSATLPPPCRMIPIPSGPGAGRCRLPWRHSAPHFSWSSPGLAFGRAWARPDLRSIHHLPSLGWWAAFPSP